MLVPLVAGTIAIVFGALAFRERSQTRRAVLGSVAFVAVLGALATSSELPKIKAPGAWSRPRLGRGGGTSLAQSVAAVMT